MTMNMTKRHTPDIIVIGGGPAGIMAAGHAAELGAKVTLVEKTYRLGSKLLMTGGGRCNITNNAGLKEFIKAFGKNGKFLYRALTVFSNKDLMEFFSSRGVQMRVDPDGKVFPSVNKAETVLAVLRKYIEDNKVRIIHNTAAAEIILKPGKTLKSAAGIKTGEGVNIDSAKVIIAAGGMSYPITGSTGDGYALAKQCGHTITPLRPGLTALESGDEFIPELQGLTLKNIIISVESGGKKIISEKGDILFTHFGVSGPKVLVLSGIIVDALSAGASVALSLNLKPGCKLENFDHYLQNEFAHCGAKTISTYLKDALPASLSPVFERRCKIEPGKRCGSLSREERKRIAELFTDFTINISKPRPIEEATVTRGGVTLGEINPHTMESRLVNGLFFCGEVLDLDGPTGGYNLQEAFSTGYLAGESATPKSEKEE